MFTRRQLLERGPLACLAGWLASGGHPVRSETGSCDIDPFTCYLVGLVVNRTGRVNRILDPSVAFLRSLGERHSFSVVRRLVITGSNGIASYPHDEMPLSCLPDGVADANELKTREDPFDLAHETTFALTCHSSGSIMDAPFPKVHTRRVRIIRRSVLVFDVGQPLVHPKAEWRKQWANYGYTRTNWIPQWDSHRSIGCDSQCTVIGVGCSNAAETWAALRRAGVDVLPNDSSVHALPANSSASETLLGILRTDFAQKHPA